MSSTRPRINGKLARRRRLERGLTVVAVAEAIGKSPWSVYRYEKQNFCPKPDVRLRLEEMYGLEPGDLLDLGEVSA